MTRKFTAVLAAVLACAGTAVFGGPAYADEIRDQQWHLEYLKVAEAQKVSTGKGVTVAVIDSGVSDHPDLSGSVLEGADFFEKGGDGRIDKSGHGTAVAGLIAAHGKNGDGALGIAPEAKILPIRVLGAKGSIDNRSPDSEKLGKDVALALDYAVKHGAKVINVSLSVRQTGALTTALSAAAAADVVVVAAAGNRPRDFAIIAPAFSSDAMAVGAIGRSGSIADVTVTGAAMDISAPGEEMTVLGKDGRYESDIRGTSLSSPIVAGAAALLRSKYPDMKATEVVERLESTAVDKGDPGVDPVYGHGVIDIVAALKGGPGAGEPSSAPATSASTSDAATPSASAALPEVESSSSNAGLIVGGIALVVLLGGAGLFFALRSRSRPGS
ncbi:type VII secretion-associated serine protease mycosin [Actinoplanes sp. NPDC051494]|uniref:type VII secretion-associated serine protease mycosin n=1 Tax=Actinoplanes sp. NPDC051494 TaxID=3363907 RepID=UPI0037B964E3